MHTKTIGAKYWNGTHVTRPLQLFGNLGTNCVWSPLLVIFLSLGSTRKSRNTHKTYKIKGDGMDAERKPKKVNATVGGGK